MRKNRRLIIIGLIIFAFIITNPTMQDFKEYTGSKREAKKEKNFIVFSIYWLEGTGPDWENYSDSHRYLGIGKNFFQID